MRKLFVVITLIYCWFLMFKNVQVETSSESLEIESKWNGSQNDLSGVHIGKENYFLFIYKNITEKNEDIQ